VFWNRLLRVLGPKRDKVTGGWRKLHKEALYRLTCSPLIIRMIRLRGGECSVCGEMGNAYRIVVLKHEGRDHSEELVVDDRIIFRWILVGN
jgi:hypothetical protein